ncbi:uncharacterized protein F5891DRAFT_943734 [Suillus fuscotomentosus]|uniref:Uncharacterized protein n=1 Tax=Suillus fuscotomentosus TaxID=1912939 RepID=A0AAD4EGA8_9AGAM|nr:uncharacterized protein F5891DRAFT_943734 [Suillus fuscotomentosus]KAG1905541.1 hypothetical protein F5891DRAFT_943734 [Suillus fuscotomentosus]
MNSVLSLTQVSTIYPGIHYQENYASLQPMCLTLCFPGTFPRQLLERSDPIRISVSIDEEYGIFTTPTIEVASPDLRCHGSILLHCSGDSDDLDLSCDNKTNISFLPLPPSFDYTNRADWQTVSQQIQEWLTTKVDMESSLWMWGHDVFWLAFISTYPSFPTGKWPMWDPRIPLEGSFIEQWLECSNDSSVDEEALAQDNVVRYIWNEFCIPFPLFPWPDIIAECLLSDLLEYAIMSISIITYVSMFGPMIHCTC